ncbi:hypothetical protein ACGFIE_01270 [Micromonospora sp. NPDC049275]|uniref:hypothetical protein n=1 Tax=unclassified Micromonospora TaxID=2617518 RepID=UPI003425DDAD
MAIVAYNGVHAIRRPQVAAIQKYSSKSLATLLVAQPETPLVLDCSLDLGAASQKIYAQTTRHP